MNREAFGKIVAAMRKDRYSFETGRVWSQQDLADSVGLTQRIISRIERGKQSRLDGELLQRLAKAFNLSSMERNEFFAMASEVNGDEVVRSDLCSGESDGLCCGEVFGKVWNMLESVQSPAFLMDSFGDVVGINRCLMAFYNINTIDLQARKSSGRRLNCLEMMMVDDSTSIRQVLGGKWRSIALDFMQQWRVMTLRHRHTSRYKDLFTMLSNIPEFRLMWAVENGSADVLHDCSYLRNCTYRHGLHGLVNYTVFANSTLCVYGELYLSVMVARDVVTSALFQKLANQNKGLFAITPWPNVGLT